MSDQPVVAPNPTPRPDPVTVSPTPPRSPADKPDPSTQGSWSPDRVTNRTPQTPRIASAPIGSVNDAARPLDLHARTVDGRPWEPDTWLDLKSRGGPDYRPALSRREGDFDLTTPDRHRYGVGRTLELHPQSAPDSRVLIVIDRPHHGNADQDDPAIEASIDLATRMGFGRLMIISLFAAQVDETKDLRRHPNAIGVHTREVWQRALRPRPNAIIAAWGSKLPAGFTSYVTSRRNMLADEQAGHFGLTANGQPKHITAINALDVARRLEPVDPR